MLNVASLWHVAVLLEQKQHKSNAWYNAEAFLPFTPNFINLQKGSCSYSVQKLHTHFQQIINIYQQE